MSTEAKTRSTLVSRGDNFACYPLMQLKKFILYWMLIKYIVKITFGFKTIQVKWIFVCVFRTPYIHSYTHSFIRRQSESMVNRTRINSAQSIFFLYHPSSSNINRCQVTSRDRTWFRDSASDIDFYQMSLSQSESTILHESII